jgi:phosphoglycolate phosphatase
MKNYNTILFDLDGTLTDSGPGILNAVVYAMEKFGFPTPDEAVLRSFVGPPLHESFERVCSFDADKAQEAVRVFREYYNDTGIFENSVYPGMKQALSALVDAGKTLGVATSKPETAARRVLDYFDLSKYFTVIVGASADGTRIQKADVVTCAMEQLGVTSGQALMVGDREHDVRGAAANGLECLGVLYGYGDRAELENAGAIALASTAQEMAEMILSGK